MSARDDFGSSAGRGPGAGGLGNGGIGGGMGAGSRGGGAGYNGGGMGAGQAFGRAKQAYDAWKDSQIEQGPLNRPTINRPAPNRPAPVTPPSYPAYEAEMALPEYPPVPEIDITPASTALPNAAWFTTNSNINYPIPTGAAYDQRFSPDQFKLGTRDTDSTNGGYPSLDPKGSYPPGMYASGGLVRSAMLTAKGVSNGMKGALVVNQKGNVVSGKLKSGPIVQVGTGGNVMKRGTVKITWGS